MICSTIVRIVMRKRLRGTAGISSSSRDACERWSESTDMLSREEDKLRELLYDTLGVCTIKTAFVCYASCVNCLKKDLFVNIKVICVIWFYARSFLQLIWIECAIIAFVEGVFAKCSAIIDWQKNFHFNLSLKWNYLEKDKNPWIQNPFYVFKISSLYFGQINFCTTSKL